MKNHIEIMSLDWLEGLIKRGYDYYEGTSFPWLHSKTLERAVAAAIHQTKGAEYFVSLQLIPEQERFVVSASDTPITGQGLFAVRPAVRTADDEDEPAHIAISLMLSILRKIDCQIKEG